MGFVVYKPKKENIVKLKKYLTKGKKDKNRRADGRKKKPKKKTA